MSHASGHNVRGVRTQRTEGVLSWYNRLVLVVQKACTTCTKSMYYLYKGYVLVVQRHIRLEKQK